MTHMKKSLLTIVLLVCSVLLWKPVRAEAAEQTVGNLVLMVDFANDTGYFQTNYKNCEAIYTKQSVNSVHSYISAISDGKVAVNSLFPQDNNDTFVPITLSKNCMEYTETDFITEVVNKVNDLCQAGQLANIEGLNTGNQEGCIDNVTFLVKVGDGQDDKSGPYYPHKADGAGQWELFGKKVAAYNVIPSTRLWITEGGTAYDWGYTTVSHELLHSLGAPDLYRTTGDTGEPVGIWDHMAAVSVPANYPLVYTRKDLGWIPEEDTPVVTQSGDYTLVPAENSSGTRAYILKTKLSSSQFFVVEYRVKTEAVGDGTRGYEYELPESGLIVYRVNTALADYTNATGENYMYVFRPGTQDSRDARETYVNEYGQTVSSVRKAAVGTTSRPTLGSADMDAPCTQDTIFYDDGSNSGIVISNVRYENGTATFHVEFPKLEDDAYWLQQGQEVSGLRYPAITGSEDGARLYLAGNYNGQAALYESENGGDWKNIVTVSAMSSNIYDVIYVNGQVYMLYIDTTGTLSVGRYADGQWNTVYTYDSGYYPNKASFMLEDGNVWVRAYASGKLRLVNISAPTELPAITVSKGEIANPTAFYRQGKWYAVYSDYLASGDTAKGRVACYDPAGSIWTDIYTINSLEKVQQAEACVVGDTVYIVAKSSGQNNVFMTWDGNTWTEQALNDIDMSTGFQLIVKDQIPYIIWNQGTILRARYLKNGVWTELANTISSDANAFAAFCGGDILYVASSSLANCTTVRKMKTVEGTPDPDPSPTPDPTATPDPKPTQTPAPTETPDPNPTSTPNPTATPDPNPTPTPNPTATPDPNPTPTPNPTATPDPNPTPAPNPTATPDPNPTPVPVPTATPNPNPTPTPAPTETPDPNPTPTPVPEVGSGNVVITLPEGYDSSAKLYIDGVEYTSTAWQDDESKRLVAIGSTGPLGTTAETALMCRYNASGIPTGMYVWRLSYNGSYYIATAIPEFENLFSYHGFSVRYTGNTGLRCTFGIDTTKKAQLISDSGLVGYRITEMGTLIMRPDLHASYPMVYGSNKLQGGRTYYVENGKVFNKVIRTVNGRDYFANVLTKLPPQRYDTAYVFRPYAVMENNGSRIVIYGPEMSRSMYTVCKQILDRGDFKPGTSGYQFLKNIVDTVEQ